MLPMGEVAIDYLGIYEENSRPFLLKSEQTDAYFLSTAPLCTRCVAKA
jgi:integrase/recombinase XerD